MNWKMIYLARRNPALAAEDFAQAWREHSALGRQCRNVGQRVRSVTQCSRLLDLALPGASSDYDGVNLLLLADRESARAIWSDPETLAIMRPDEPRVFDRYVREFTLVCREAVLRDGERSPVVLHGFLRRRADLGEADIRVAWQAADPARPWLGGALGQAAARIVVNEVVEAPPPGYAYDLIVEWWFESAAALQRAVGDQDLRSHLRPALAALLDLPGSVFMATQVTHRRP
ncbi:MAG TPA: EthD domain-containing protein [Burkholderiaceae bacterium]|nr:EthD domain-containing protein [Burkholderiaceae bacterium]HMZ00104.1 EthD domain-containing protein [Burkholderiaceae bacterium]HNB44656.1 EthD domain-containing protein [Burkholderiaceae bacterium]HNG80345.1 EthD domain-containing protein [Burkholderiaceae bacterium]